MICDLLPTDLQASRLDVDLPEAGRQVLAREMADLIRHEAHSEPLVRDRAMTAGNTSSQGAEDGAWPVPGVRSRKTRDNAGGNALYPVRRERS